MTELTDQQVLDRAQHAKRLFNDEMFKDIVAEMRADLIRAWENAGACETREALHADMRALTRITNLLYSIGDGGEILERQLEKRERHEQ